MELTIWTFVIVCPLVFLAGFIDAAAGGGGLISLPAYLLAGLPPHLASGTNKASAMCGTTAAFLRYLRSGKVHWRAALPSMLGALPGAYIGAKLQLWLPGDAVRILMAVAIPLLAIPLLRNKTLTPKRRLPNSPVLEIALYALTGLIIGAYDGFLGPGTGTFLILIFVFLFGLDAVTASGSAKVANLASNVAAFIAFALEGQVLYMLALPAAACAVLGGFLGAHLMVRKGSRFVKPIILLVLALLLVRLGIDLYQSLSAG